VVNDVPKIHCGDAVTRESHSIIVQEPSLRIPLHLDGVFFYFKTRGLSQDEQLNCDEIEHVVLTPDANEWDPHNKSYERNEASFTDYRGDLNYPSPKRPKVIDDRDYIDFDVSSERFEAAIDAVCASNDINLVDDSNPQDMDDVFNMDQDDPIRANVANLSVL